MKRFLRAYTKIKSNFQGFRICAWWYIAQCGAVRLAGEFKRTQDNRSSGEHSWISRGKFFHVLSWLVFNALRTYYPVFFYLPSYVSGHLTKTHCTYKNRYLEIIKLPISYSQYGTSIYIMSKHVAKTKNQEVYHL